MIEMSMTEFVKYEQEILRLKDEIWELKAQLKEAREVAERKVEKLKQLLLLTDPAVDKFVVSETAITQWLEFIKEFPDEGHNG